MRQASIRYSTFAIRHSLVAGALALIGACAPDTARVTVYCSVDEEFARQVLDAFTQETGIVVRPVFDSEAGKTTGLVNRIRAENDAIGNMIYGTQMVSDRFSLTSGTSYRTAVYLRADEARTVDVWVQACCEETIHFFNERVNVTTEWTLFDRSFTAEQSSDEVFFEIQFGEVSIAPVYVDGIVVEAL